jgi:hypothetical protein
MIANETPLKLSGSLITSATSAAFEDIVSRALAISPAGCSDVPAAALRPAIACVPDLLDQAGEVLAGNPIAADRFRQMLGSFGGAHQRTRIGERIASQLPAPKLEQVLYEPRGCLGVLLPRARPRGHRPRDSDHDPFSPPPVRLEPLVTMERLEPVLAAAVYVARDARELAELIGGIELGLTGVAELNTLFQLARSGAGAPDTFGFRTATAVTDAVPLPPPSPRGWIIEPPAGSRWPSGWRGSLIGTLCDTGGRLIDWEQQPVFWMLNGQRLASRRQITPWQLDEPGDHVIRLVRDTGDGQFDVLDEITIGILPPTAEQKEYADLIATRALR